MKKPVWPPLMIYARLADDPTFKLSVQETVKKALDDYEEDRLKTHKEEKGEQHV